MKPSKMLIWLSMLIALLAAMTASIGLFWRDDANSFVFTTLRGQAV